MLIRFRYRATFSYSKGYKIVEKETKNKTLRNLTLLPTDTYLIYRVTVTWIMLTFDFVPKRSKCMNVQIGIRRVNQQLQRKLKDF